MADKEKLFEIMYEKSFKYQPSAPFTLVSGYVSPLYFDCKATMLNPKGLALIGNIFANKMIDLASESKIPGDIDCIGGITMGADPIIFSTSLTFSLQQDFRCRGDLYPLIIRKEAKGHGTKKYIEGNFKFGDKVIVVDDVITTGGSTIKAIDALKYEGLKVVHCIVLVDREEFNGKQNIEDLGIEVTSIFKAHEFIYKYTQEKK